MISSSCQASACLRFFGDDLQPKLVSRLMDSRPTEAWRKGELFARDGVVTRRPTGGWVLFSPEDASGDLNQTIQALLLGVTRDRGVWENLCRRFHADIRCGLFPDQISQSAQLSPRTLSMLGVRRLRLNLDIYGGIFASSPPHPAQASHDPSDLDSISPGSITQIATPSGTPPGETTRTPSRKSRARLSLVRSVP